jgi:ABC-type lipoprotein export system ATPase subunit
MPRLNQIHKNRIKEVSLLKVVKLHKGFEGDGTRQPLLQGVDFCLMPGEICLLLGQSGCGKSTLLNLIAGLIAPDSGEIWLGDTRLDLLSSHALAQLRGREFGIVYQDFNLLATLTVAENLRLPREINGQPQDEAALTQLLDELGLGAKRHAWPEQLSGGQRQRVALGRALIHHPAWLLADEPTGSLDEENAEQMMALMVAAVRERGTGLLQVSHNPAYAALADRVLRLSAGRLQPVERHPPQPASPC